MVLSSFNLSDDFSRRLIEFPERAESSEDQAQARIKVLVVDDQRLIVDTIADILQGAGFEVVGADDGWAALSAMALFRPDFLLSDVLMPKMNGVELAITVRKMYPSTKILLFTGQAGISEIMEEAQSQGFEFELIPKPIHPLKLIERLQKE